MCHLQINSGCIATNRNKLLGRGVNMQQNNEDAFRLLDAAEACAALRIGKSTLQKLVREGKLKRSSVSVGRSLFPMSEIQRLISTPLEIHRAA